MHLERIVAGIAAGLMALGANAALYKWVDERGVVQYSDKPPANTSKGGVQMSPQGIVVKKLDTGMTPEQEKAKAEEDARQRREAQEAAAQRRADQALLQSFTSAAEIDMKRDRELESLDAIIATLRGQERLVGDRLGEDRKRREAWAKRGAKIPPGFDEDILRGEVERTRLRRDIERREREKDTTRERYDVLKKRYLELREPAKAATVAAPTGTGTSPAAKK